MRQTWPPPSLFRLFAMREAIASVSLSHPASCDCQVCRAVGDEEAMHSLVVRLLEREEAER
jgi:hypothetical protein